MSIFDENDYKEILRRIVNVQKKTNRGIYRKISEYIGVSPSLVSQIISGPNNFTEEQLVLVCEYLGLPNLESRYLLTLLQIDRAGSVKLQDYYKLNLEGIRNQARDISKQISVTKTLTEFEKSKFYSSWTYSAAHLMSTLNKSPQFNDICQRLSLSQSEAQRIINFLLEIGMIIEDQGVYKPGTTDIHLEKDSPFVSNVHKNWRIKALQVVDRLHENELMYSCNFSVDQTAFMEIRSELSKTILQFLKMARTAKANDIAQFNLDLFWIR